MISPDVLRDGTRIREIKRELDEQRQMIGQLYEHWEEALELNQ